MVRTRNEFLWKNCAKCAFPFMLSGLLLLVLLDSRHISRYISNVLLTLTVFRL